MKKSFKSLFVIIAAMVTFAGCQKEENNAPATQTKTVEFFAESIDTKTQFDTPVDGVYPTIWNKGDKVKIFLNLESANGTEATSEVQFADADAQTSSSARFEAKIAEVEAPSYTFYAVAPSIAYKSGSRDAATNKFVLTVPSSQTPLDGTVDKSAQVLLAKVTEGTMPSSVSMNFGHITAYGKFSLTGLSEDVTVKSIVIETQEGLSLAGEFEYNVNDGALSASAGKNTLTLMTSKKQDIWFACAPVDVSNTSVTFTVDTDKGVYVKNVAFPAERKFEPGKISSFSISFASISPVVSEKKYQKVTADLSDWSGKYLIVYESGTNAYVFNGQDAANGYVSATISEGKITSTDALAAVQVTIESMEGGYAVKTANGYISGTKGSNKLNFDTSTQQLNTISLGNDGVLLTSNTSVLRFNATSGQMRFRYYKSESYSGQKAICLYRLVDGESGGEEEPDTPAAPVLSVTATEVSVGAAGGNGEIDYTVENAVAGKIISAATTVDWISNFNYSAAGKVTFAVSANTGVERSAVVTLTYPGAAESKEVTVKQAAGGETPDPTPDPEEPENPGTGGGDAPESATVTMSSFSATSASMDEVVSYTTAKGNGTSNPGVYSGQIRLYQNSAGIGGGTITITAKEGYTLSSVTIGSGMATNIAYTIGTSTTKSESASLAKDNKYTVNDINASSITFYCMGKTSSTRLYVNYLSATYTN